MTTCIRNTRGRESISAQPLSMFIRISILLSLILFAGCQGDPDDHRPVAAGRDGGDSASIAVQLQLNWFPDVQHGGYYAALVHGFYEQQGLKVSIRPGGPGVPVVAQVASGRAAFGVAGAENVLLGWPQQAPTIGLMAPMQHSPRCIMVHEQSGIRSFDQLEDLTLAMSSSSLFSVFLQKRLPLKNVRIVPYSGNVAPFLLDRRYAQQAFVFSEPIVARSQGSQPHVLMVSDLGYDPYASVLITRPQMIENQPDVVAKMVRASIQGWQQYLDDPEPTNRYLAELNREMDSEVLRSGVGAMVDLCLDESVTSENFGQMTLDRWRALHDQLIEVNALSPDAVDPQSVFTTAFLPTSDSPPQ
jgi:NitT/TauT family transport system substrate-binding protein